MQDGNQGFRSDDIILAPRGNQGRDMSETEMLRIEVGTLRECYKVMERQYGQLLQEVRVFKDSRPSRLSIFGWGCVVGIALLLGLIALSPLLLAVR